MTVHNVGLHALPRQDQPVTQNDGICSTIIKTIAVGLGALSILASYVFLDPLSATVLSGMILLLGYGISRDSSDVPARTSAAFERQPLDPPTQTPFWWRLLPSFSNNRPVQHINPQGQHAIPGQRHPAVIMQPPPAQPPLVHAIPGHRAPTIVMQPPPAQPTLVHAIPGTRNNAPPAATLHAIPGNRSHAAMPTIPLPPFPTLAVIPPTMGAHAIPGSRAIPGRGTGHAIPGRTR